MEAISHACLRSNYFHARVHDPHHILNWTSNLINLHIYTFVKQSLGTWCTVVQILFCEAWRIENGYTYIIRTVVIRWITWPVVHHCYCLLPTGPRRTHHWSLMTKVGSQLHRLGLKSGERRWRQTSFVPTIWIIHINSLTSNLEMQLPTFSPDIRSKTWYNLSILWKLLGHGCLKSQYIGNLSLG